MDDLEILELKSILKQNPNNLYYTPDGGLFLKVESISGTGVNEKALLDGYNHVELWNAELGDFYIAKSLAE